MARLEDIKYEPRLSIGKIDNIPIPSREILRYASDHELLRPELKGLVLHILTGLVVSDVLVNAVKEANDKKPRKKNLMLMRI